MTYNYPKTGTDLHLDTAPRAVFNPVLLLLLHSDKNGRQTHRYHAIAVSLGATSAKRVWGDLGTQTRRKGTQTQTRSVEWRQSAVKEPLLRRLGKRV